MIKPPLSGMSSQLAAISGLGVATASVEAQLADAVTGHSRDLPYPIAYLPVDSPWADQAAPPVNLPTATGAGATIGT